MAKEEILSKEEILKKDFILKNGRYYYHDKGVWEEFEIEDKYLSIIASKEFQDLKNKRQLGINPYAKHTRFEHSLGVYHLACELIETCKSKFSNYLEDVERDEKAIKLFALLHDIGHSPFSHFLESMLGISHEEKTVEILRDTNSELHQIIVQEFGESTIEDVVELVQMRKTADEGKIHQNGKVSLISIVQDLLSGGIDIDRIDYIKRDAYNTMGIVLDFSDIFEYMTLVAQKDRLNIAFRDSAVFKICDFFNRRYELYNTKFFCAELLTLEEICKNYISLKKLNITKEQDLIDSLKMDLNNPDPVIRHMASLFEYLYTEKKVVLDSILIKEYNDSNLFNSYFEDLERIPDLTTKYKNCIYTSTRYQKIISKDSAPLMCREDNTVCKLDELEGSLLKSDMRTEKHIISVDFEILKILMRNDGKTDEQIAEYIAAIQKTLSNTVKEERRYLFKDNTKVSLENGINEIKDTFNLDESNSKDQEFEEEYYDDGYLLMSNHITVKKTIINGIERWKVTRNFNDETLLNKKAEKNFHSREEAEEYIRNYWKIPIYKIEKVADLSTKRKVFTIKYLDSEMEIIFDLTTTDINNEVMPGRFMLKTRLKSGNSIDLFFLDKDLKEKFSLLQTNESKVEIARKTYMDMHQSQVSQQSIEVVRGSFKNLDNQRKYLNTLKEKYGKLKKPIVFTVFGTPCSLQTTTAKRLHGALKYIDFDTLFINHPTNEIYRSYSRQDQKKIIHSDLARFNFQLYNIAMTNINDNYPFNDIIVCDGGIFESFLWFETLYKMGSIKKEDYDKHMEKLKEEYPFYNHLIITQTDAKVAMERDKLWSASDIPRTTLSMELVEVYNQALNDLFEKLDKKTDGITKIDTTNSQDFDKLILGLCLSSMKNIECHYIEHR